jgi:hypothetical protein
MPKKKPGMTPEEQSERFKRDAQKLIDAGDLSPTEAAAAMERVIANVRTPKRV